MGGLCTRRGGDNRTPDHHIAMSRRQLIAGVIIMLAIIMGNLGGLWLASTL